jgi:hypothetical protein
MDNGYTPISTLVGNKWRVSTIWRQCSSQYSDHWYYETIIWEWNNIEHQLGKMLVMGQGLKFHWDAVLALHEKGADAIKELSDGK